jgi:hypothetical protein
MTIPYYLSLVGGFNKVHNAAAKNVEFQQLPVTLLYSSAYCDFILSFDLLLCGVIRQPLN